MRNLYHIIYIRGTDMKNIIYGYKKLTTNEIVYVGQTTDLQTRRLKHEKYDPFNPNTKEYIPLSLITVTFLF